MDEILAGHRGVRSHAAIGAASRLRGWLLLGAVVECGSTITRTPGNGTVGGGVDIGKGPARTGGRARHVPHLPSFRARLCAGRVERGGPRSAVEDGGGSEPSKNFKCKANREFPAGMCPCGKVRRIAPKIWAVCREASLVEDAAALSLVDARPGKTVTRENSGFLSCVMGTDSDRSRSTEGGHTPTHRRMNFRLSRVASPALRNETGRECGTPNGRHDRTRAQKCPGRFR